MAFGGIMRHGAAWSIGVYRQDRLTLPPDGAPAHLLRTDRLRLPGRPHTLADPFLFARGSRLFLFYEEQIADEFGTIAVAEVGSRDIVPLGTVLAEPFHLSYPCVFAVGDAVYLIPESRGARAVRLYRFAAFPAEPVFVRTLLGGDYADPSPVCVDGRWYLFATSPRGLELFHTDDLVHRTLAPHPLSPLTDDPARRRCGGVPFVYGGALVRPAQDGHARFGAGLSLLAIRELSQEQYREELLAPEVLPPGASWNAGGGHHLSVCAMPHGHVVAVDGQAPDYLVNRLGIRAWMAATGRARR